MGTNHMVAAGHYLAAEAGYRILEQGGNAIDAGVAAGIAINVLLPESTNFGGVAPLSLPRRIRFCSYHQWPGSLAPFCQHRLLHGACRR